MSYVNVLYRTAWLLLGLLFVVGALFLFIPKCRSLHELQRVRDDLEAENGRTAAETQELVRKQQRFQSDPQFVERTAHESGRIKSNETVFFFPEEQGARQE